MARHRLCLASAVLLANASSLSAAEHGLRLETTLRAARSAPPTVAPRPPASLRLKPSLSIIERAAGPRSVPSDAPHPRVPPPPAPVAQPGAQALIVSVTVNEVPKGDLYGRLGADGAVLLRREDVLPITAAAATLPAVAIDNEDYVDPRAMPGVQVRFEEATLTLHLRFPPAALPRQLFDLTSQRPPAELAAPPTSLLFAYRAGYWGSDDASDGTLSLSTDSAFAWDRWLLRNRTYHARTDEGVRSARLETQLVRDDLADLRRLILGDFVTPGLPLGASVALGGLSYAKAYLLSPYLVRYPTLGYQGMAESPSRVDFYVGNTLVLRRQVAPGPFDIRNFSFYGGARDVRVVIRDALGREQTIAHPFYFATQGLSQGLHDYAYQLGAVRDDLEGTTAAYGKAAYSVFHQYGFTDALTLGLRSEGTRHAQNAGFDAYYRNEALGLFSLNGGVSRDSGRGNGSAVRLSYAFLRNDFNSYLVWQRFSEDYAVLHGEFTPRLPKQDLSANIGYTTRFGSFGLGLTRLQLHGEPVHRTGLLSWTLPISSHLSINTYARREWGERRDTQYFVGLQYNPSIDLNGSLTHLHDTAGGRTTTLQVSNRVPRGEGVAWALGAQRQEIAEGQSVLLTPRVQWNARYATLAAEASHLRGGPAGDTTAYTAALDGAVVATGGRLAMTRAIPDAFAIVETAPPMAGIRVYENSQEIGRTDASGRILLTNITSYATSQASIQDKDVPIEYSIDKVHRTFSVPTRSGRVVAFAITRIRAFTGYFRYRAGERVLPLEFVMVTVTAGGQKFEAPTGVAGEFYIENLPPGRAHAVSEVDGNPCEFTFEVPQSDDNLVSLGNITGCDAPR